MSIDKNQILLIKAALLKQAQEPQETAFPRVSFGPPGANSPLNNAKAKWNINNADFRNVFGPTGSHAKYPKSLGSAPASQLQIPGVNLNNVDPIKSLPPLPGSSLNGAATPKPEAESLYSAVDPTFQKAYGGKQRFRSYLQNFVNPKILKDPAKETVGDRASIYKAVQNDIYSKPQNDKVRNAYDQEIENMRRYSLANRTSGGFNLVTSPSLMPMAIPTLTDKDLENPNKDIAQMSKVAPAITMPSKFDNFIRQMAKQSPMFDKINPDAVLLHELEHTNQQNPQIRGSLGRFQTEIPAVASEIAHMAEAYRSATGKYPSGSFLDKPYGDLAQMAIKNKHIYGNNSMTSVLNQPENQKWLQDYMTKVKQNEEFQKYISSNPSFGKDVITASNATAKAVFPRLYNANKAYNSYTEANPYRRAARMPAFNPNYGALQRNSGGYETVPYNERTLIPASAKPAAEPIRGRDPKDIEQLLKRR